MKRFFCLFILLSLLLPLTTVKAQLEGEDALADQYFKDGEFESALPVYLKLQKEKPDLPLYITRIAACYKVLEQFDEGKSFLEKVIRKNPGIYSYQFILSDLLRSAGKEREAQSIEDEVINKKLATQEEFLEAGTFLTRRERYELALGTYLRGRKVLKSDYIFGNELAEIYTYTGKFDQATREYLLIYQSNPPFLDVIKVSVLNLVYPNSKDQIEQVLLEFVQKDPNDLGIRTIVYEFYVLTENFMEAFVQVKSIDRLFKENGERAYQFAMTLRNNKEYSLSNKALDYVIDRHKESPYYFQAFQEKIVNNELEAFESIPVDTNAVRKAVIAYNEVLNTFGRKPSAFKSMYRKANLLAFYLFDLNEALKELENLSTMPLQAKEKAEANLLVGDILLMKKEFNTSKLKYAEVTELFQDGQIGAMAKFREGRLYYFAGDFELSKARLESIKDNTSNDISNDAIKLYVLMQDNLGLDTVPTALKMFANAQLLVFQRDFEPALELLDSILFQFPSHGISDEIFWEKANIYLSKSDLEKSLQYLNKVLDNYPDDILGDDALFTKAKIFDYSMNDKETAMQLYVDFLRKYTGSMYIVQVRKRVRELRADSPKPG